MTELQIEYLMDAVHTLNFSQTAQNLHVTQPSVSFQIGNLEKELNLCIFDRSKKSSLSITPAGKLLIQTILQMRSQFQNALQMAHVLEDKKAFTAKIGIFSAWNLTPLILSTKKYCEQLYPDSEIVFESYCFSELLHLLQDDCLDAILTVQTTIPSFEKLTIKKVCFNEACFLYNSNHVLADPAHATLADFSSSSDSYFVLPQTESPLSTNINYSYFLSNSLQPKVITRPNIDSIILSIKANEGYGIFDTWTKYISYPDVSVLKLEEQIPICLVHKIEHENPLIDLFYQEAISFSKQSKSMPLGMLYN